MQFVISQNSFAQALSSLFKIATGRATHPILNNIKIVASDNQITLTAFDLNIGIEIDVVAKVVKDGAITVPYMLVNNIVSRLPDEDVTFSLKEDIATLKCGNGKYTVNCLPITEYPDLPTVDSDEPFLIDMATLKEGLAATLMAVSGNETKRILTGVCVTSGEDSIEFAATDGHRLSTLTKPIENTVEFNSVIPAKALRELEKLADKSIEIQSNQSNMLFKFSNGVLITCLIDGTYPNYRQLIPKSFALTVTVERKLLQSALERVGILADQKNNVVKLNIDAEEQTISLSVDSPDIAAGQEVVPAQITGDSVEIALNVLYLKDGLKAILGNEIQLQINTPQSPVVIVPISGASQEYLLMPVQIRS
jgi:DNA polymerase-3 subunit beta